MSAGPPLFPLVVPNGPLPPNQALPAQLRAGDTLNFIVAAPSQLTPGTLIFFALTAVINNVPVQVIIGSPNSAAPAAVAVDANGNATFAIPSPTTDTWQPGRYQWVAFSLDTAGNREEIAAGSIRILPDVAGSIPVDPRSYNQQLLSAIRLLLQGKALDDAQMYKIGNRELTKYSPKDLMFWEAVVEARVKRDRRRAGEFVPTSNIGILFGGR